MAEDQDQLFTRLIEHYRGQGRVGQLETARGGADEMTRRVFARYGDNALGLLEITTMAVTDGHLITRQITWTRNAELTLDSEQPVDYRSRMALFET